MADLHKRFKLRIIDKRFGSKKYVIFDTLNKTDYIEDNRTSATVYHNHSGYVKARSIVDSMNKKFMHNLRYGKTPNVKAEPKLTAESVYAILSED